MKLREPEVEIKASAPRLLVSAIERLAGARTQAEVIETLRATARTLAGADGICVVLRDNGKCHYIEEDAISPLWKGGKFPLESCISGWAMTNNQTVVIPDVFADDRIPHVLYRERFVKSLVMTPIGRNEPIAALGAYWAKPYLAPKEVVDTLQTLARAAATALENVHLVGALSASLRITELVRDDLRHRLSNALSAIEAFGNVTLKKDEARALSMRIAAMARAHALLDKEVAQDSPVLMNDLVEAELAPYRPQALGDIEVSGPETKVAGAQALSVGLVLNELALASARTGAIAAGKGRLKVRWREDAGVITLEWREAGGQSVVTSATESTNSQVVKALVNGQLQGTVHKVVADGAVTCFIEFKNQTAKAFE